MKPNLQPCPDCGQLVSATAAACPHCGKKLRLDETAKVIILLVIIAAIVGLTAAMYSVTTKAEKLHDEIEALTR